MRRAIGLMVVCGTLLLCGCAQRGAGLPIGHWSGHGEFLTVHAADAAQGQTSTTAVKHATYSTTLDVAHATGADAGLLRLEILSLRGPIPGLDGDRTHMIMLLRPHATADPGVWTYRIVRGGLSLDASAPKMEEPPPGEAHASLMRSGGADVFQIHYMRDLTDTIRFSSSGERLTKDGSYASEPNEGFINWTEELTRTGAAR